MLSLKRQCELKCMDLLPFFIRMVDPYNFLTGRFGGRIR